VTEPLGGQHRRSLRLRSLESLDWPRVVEALAERTATDAGRRTAEGLELLEDVAEGRLALESLAEMIALRAADSPPPLGGIEDVAPLLMGLRKGEILPGSELLRIAHTLEGLQRLHFHLMDRAEQAPKLAVLAHRIRPLPDLAAWLLSSFDGRGELSSATYPQLTELRSRKSRLHSKITATLDRLRGEDRFDGALMDDASPLRGDRYVLPIKAQHKRAGLGIVHDTSGSGQTVFVEPWEIVEQNNDLKVADAELRHEERRILADLCERVALVSEELARGLRGAAELDLLHAKARMAQDTNSTVPTLSKKPRIHLIAARHPILSLRGLEVVPNDLTLGGGAGDALVLSGPNTGGKTISLKTLGLAALMTRAGLAFPCDEGSVVGWFPHVLTDIGDLQDIEGDLSTFSAHVLGLVEILDALDSTEGAGLVLVDEIAAGTDPVQGAALGRAVLESLLHRGILLATTTHYAALKAVSATDDRFVNARVGFDAAAGVPTYRVHVGLPGSSHALDVAARVGLPAHVLDRARALLDPAEGDVEGMLGDLQEQLEGARNELEEAKAIRAVAEAELAEVRAERDEVKRQRKELERDVRAEFEREVRGYRDSVRGALRQMKADGDTAAAERARQRIGAGAAAVRERLGDVDVEPSVDALDPASVAVGDRVRVATLGKDGTVAVAPDKRGRVTVEVQGLRMQVPSSALERPRSAAPTKKPSKPKPPRPSRAAPARSDDLSAAFRTSTNLVDLRGTRVDEALERVDARLDEASLAGEPHLFVLHGHGTGALKAAVRKHLRSASQAGKFASGDRTQGGDGITVVQVL